MAQVATVTSAAQARRASAFLSTISSEASINVHVKSETVGRDKLLTCLHTLKSQLMALTNQRARLTNLHSKLQVKARTDKLLQHRPEELQQSYEQAIPRRMAAGV